MDTPTKSQTLPKLGLAIEDLMKAAFIRTKDRFLSYVLAYLLSFLIGLGVGAAIALLVGLNAVVWFGSKSVPVSAITSLISGVAALLGLIYVGSWTSLAITASIISPQKMGVTEYFKSVKPFVWDYYWVSLLTGLFMLGLLPFGLLSFFIIYILWSIWGAFLVFVFLDRKEKGLQNLFISKAIVSTKFWGVVLRILILYVAYYAIVYGITLAQTSSQEASGVLGILSFIISIIAGPFIISYLYELYRNLPEPTQVGSNTVWKILSIVGGVIMVLSLFFGSMALAKNGPELLEQLQNSQSLEQKMLQQIENPKQGEMTDEEYQQFEQEMNTLMKDLDSGSGTNDSEGSNSL
jgi:hypothetical protein